MQGGSQPTPPGEFGEQAQTGGSAPALRPSALQVALAARLLPRLSGPDPGGACRLPGRGSASAARRAWAPAPGSGGRGAEPSGRRFPERQCVAAGGCDLSLGAGPGLLNGGSLRRRLWLLGTCRGGGRGDAAQALTEADVYLPVPQVWALRLFRGRRGHHRVRLPVRRGEYARSPGPAAGTRTAPRRPCRRLTSSGAPHPPCSSGQVPASAFPPELRELSPGLRFSICRDPILPVVWGEALALPIAFPSGCFLGAPKFDFLLKALSLSTKTLPGTQR